jgi:hypothetical protein
MIARGVSVGVGVGIALALASKSLSSCVIRAARVRLFEDRLR